MNYLAIAAALAAFDLLAAWCYRLLRASRRRTLSTKNPESRRGASRQEQLLSLVVPAWNEEAVISDCLKHVSECEDPRMECIVVAGGHDKTYEISQTWSERDQRIHTVPQRDKGLGAALNDGISLSNGEIVVWLSADTIIEEDTPVQIRRMFADGVDILLPDLLPISETDVSLKTVVDNIRAHEILGKTDLSGGAVAFRRHKLERLLPFPEDIETAIDWDLGKRAQRLGFSVLYWRNSGIRTELPSTLKQHFGNTLRWRRSELRWTIREIKLAGGSADYGNLIPWLTSLLVLGFPLGASALYVARDGTAFWLLLSVLVLAWNTARNATPPAEVALYDHNWKWLSLLPITTLLYILDMVATSVSVITFWRRMWDFKGSRSHRKEP